MPWSATSESGEIFVVRVWILDLGLQAIVWGCVVLVCVVWVRRAGVYVFCQATVCGCASSNLAFC